jgi:hypothetical protein
MSAIVSSTTLPQGHPASNEKYSNGDTATVTIRSTYSKGLSASLSIVYYLGVY